MPAIVHGCAPPDGRRLIALTFDDGPSDVTPRVLDVLAAHGRRSTFFVLGRSVPGREHMLQRAVTEGHELGNHLFSHTHPGWLEDAELLEELERTSALIERATAVRPRLVRPPYGEDSERVAAIAAGIGLEPTVLWTVDPKDWRPSEPQRLAEHVLRAARPGAIVDLHDGGGTDATAEALGLLLPALAERGYLAVTVSELLATRAIARTRPLRATDLLGDPVEQFGAWFADALELGLPRPEAVALATADAEARPSARMVLLKDFSAAGFVFHSNYESRKGRELADNPHGALLFHWHGLGRQVRVEGTVARVGEAESDEYFRTRPSGGRTGAWASRQSEVIAGREELEQAVAATRARLGDDPPRPPFWGGYRLAPEQFEFWQHRDDRLHDRFRYRLSPSGWVRERLSP